jgi:hypothetical protein
MPRPRRQSCAGPAGGRPIPRSVVQRQASSRAAPCAITAPIGRAGTTGGGTRANGAHG